MLKRTNSNIRMFIKEHHYFLIIYLSTEFAFVHLDIQFLDFFNTLNTTVGDEFDAKKN